MIPVCDDIGVLTESVHIVRLLIISIAVGISVVISIEHDRFVRWFQPIANKIKK